MKKLALPLPVLGLLIVASLSVFAYEDHRDHDWNDEYWHHHRYGYWHGERGYWVYLDHKHEFIRVSPEFGGLRTRAADKGITFNSQYMAEVWGNPTGGISGGTAYTGVLSLQGNVDLQKLLGWRGATFSTRWYWLSGQDISAKHIGNIFTVSNIAGFQTIRMNELWFQQNFLDDRISIRLGQSGADSEFDVSTYSIVFLNSTFGWCPCLFTNLPNGGPSYPMGTPAIRLALAPLTWLSYQGAVFQGNPFAQNVNQHGFRWDLSASNGYFSIHELIFRINQGSKASGLPGTFKVAGWFDTAPEAKATGEPWNYGFYFLADQMVYRVRDSGFAAAADNKAQQSAAEPPASKGLGIFTHVGFTPQASTVVNIYVDGGLTYKGLIPTRDHDILGVALAYGHVNNNPEGDNGVPSPGYEMVLETTYQMVLTSWLSLQPDLQYVIHPAGTHIPNALVLGANVTVSF